MSPVTVVLPTIGRPELLGRCLASIAGCEPRPAEILVVDSSPDRAVTDVVAEFATSGARTIRCDRLGLGTAFNVGLREAKHDVALLTNDDCTVEPEWVARGHAHLDGARDVIVTGRVRPAGDPLVVPSIIDDPERSTYAGRPAFVLYTQSMAVRPREILDFGGFDGRISPSAEDNDLSYRWLRSGRTIHYEPDFVVWHHDWRSREQLERLYVGYGVGQGMVYGKHLRRRDPVIARYVLRDAHQVARGIGARIVRGRPENPDWRIGLLRGLPIGVVRGWRAAGRPDDGADLRA